ncbi:MAG: alpha/beta hydrolase [Ruminococcaceae bacterium]|nr:alpha/beta hydrolase [Oscillospiraceae bacterium]
MEVFWWILGIAGVLVLVVLGAVYVCFRMAFYISDKEKAENALRELPPGKAYLPFHEMMNGWQKEVKTFPYETFTVKSFDGLILKGKYYEKYPGAPIELMFHGYRGNALRDLCGGVQRSFACGHNALLVDQRASGDSEGNIISFGINERRDCHTWLRFMVEHFGPDVQILLTGISMGGATVLMAAGEELPANAIGVLSDCGYTTPKEIICRVIEKDMKLPAALAYPFVRLAARIFGGFDLEETDSVRALSNCKVPVFFVHGEADGFVPCDMSRKMHGICPGQKRLYTVPGADHGLAYPVAGEKYIEELNAFFS